MSHAGFLLTHVLVFGGPFPIFTGAINLNFRQNFQQDLELAPYHSTTGKNMKNQKEQRSSLTI